MWNRNKGKDIRSDGNILAANVRDPSTSNCFYVYPGDVGKEVYRLYTFKNFSSTAVDEHKLSQAGFYFTGYRDRVKCFSCGMCCDDWATNDDPFSANYHFYDCRHINNEDPDNVEIDRIFTKLLLKERKLSNNVNMNTRPGTSQQSASTSSRQLIVNKRTVITKKYLCLHPSNPHMRVFEVRLDTFYNSHWQSEHIRATPDQIATAGFFYMGNRDRVKCWYCNGGLQNWDTSDDPWFEHAKWFPDCEFLLDAKGDEFVNCVVTIYPDLPRPGVHNSSNSQSTSAGSSAESNDAIVIVDPRAEFKNAEIFASKEMTSNPNVNVARDMNFEDSLIKSAITRQYAENKRAFDNAEQLIDAILSLSESPDTALSRNQSPTATSQPSTTTNAFSELKSLQNNINCKVCKSKLATFFVLPCGHLCCCKHCIESVSRCPMCWEIITEKMHTYRV